MLDFDCSMLLCQLNASPYFKISRRRVIGPYLGGKTGGPYPEANARLHFEVVSLFKLKALVMRVDGVPLLSSFSRNLSVTPPVICTHHQAASVTC